MIKKRAYLGFALWYLMFFLSAISGVGYVYYSMHWLGFISRGVAVIVAFAVLICAVYILRNKRLATIFLCLIIADIFFSFRLASNNEYGDHFWENISYILPNGDLVSYYVKYFFQILRIEDIAYFVHFVLSILIITNVCFVWEKSNENISNNQSSK